MNGEGVGHRLPTSIEIRSRPTITLNDPHLTITQSNATLAATLTGIEDNS